MQLRKSIQSQLYIMMNNPKFMIAFSIMMFYSLGVYLMNVYLNMNVDISATLSKDVLFVGTKMGDYYRYLDALFPFIVLFPFAFSYLDDKKNNMRFLLQARMGTKFYYHSQMISCFIGGAIILFIPLMFNLFLTNSTFLQTGYTYYGFYNTAGYCSMLLGTNVAVNSVNVGMPFLKLYIFNPFLYNIMYVCFMSLFGGLISIWGLSCSYYIKKYKITLFIINYLLFFIGTVCNNFFFTSSTYINTNFLDYVSVNAMMGKSILFFLSFCFIMLLFSIANMARISKADQL